MPTTMTTASRKAGNFVFQNRFIIQPSMKSKVDNLSAYTIAKSTPPFMNKL